MTTELLCWGLAGLFIGYVLGFITTALMITAREPAVVYLPPPPGPETDQGRIVLPTGEIVPRARRTQVG